MKYFVISDIHSHYEVMIDCLKDAGYDKENINHHLIVLGDMFDRGEEAVSVYHYLLNLKEEGKAHIILGNHDDFLLDFLNGVHAKVEFNMKHNGFSKTLMQFSGRKEIDPSKFSELQADIINKHPKLHEFLKGLPLYLELDHYIFVHGSVDGNLDNWKDTSKRDMIWGYESKAQRVDGKTVVAGHQRTVTIRRPGASYKSLIFTHPRLFDIIKSEGKILIDRFVEISKEINVYTFESDTIL